MAKNDKMYSLIDNLPFMLFVPDGCPKRFLDLFRTSWARIPHKDRDAIRQHWANPPDQCLPRFELSNLWLDSERNFAQVTQMGREMFFGKSEFAVLPDTVAEFIIAHELAHVFQKSQGKKPGGAGETENEQDADLIAERWGFDRIAKLTFQALVEHDGFEKACAFMKTADSENIED